MGFEPHPWDKGARASGTKVWCLIKVVTPEMGPVREDPVSLFNWDSEAEMFMAHVFSMKLDGKLVDIDPTWREIFELRKRDH